jgi:pyruvate dehydrogenase E1 component beta subunit
MVSTSLTYLAFHPCFPCGFGAELSATIAEDAMFYLKAPIIRVAGYDVVLPLPKLEDF